MTERIESFPPVYTPKARVLILGTMPSVKSLEQSFYYGHPRNAFWRIMADVFSVKRPETAEEKKALLNTREIALWDVCASCVRSGSLDSAIRDVAPNDLTWLYGRLPRLRRVLFNGGAAEQLYIRHVGCLPEGCASARLPSTSPAYTMPYEAKLARWRAELEEALCVIQ